MKLDGAGYIFGLRSDEVEALQYAKARAMSSDGKVFGEMPFDGVMVAMAIGMILHRRPVSRDGLEQIADMLREAHFTDAYDLVADGLRQIDELEKR